MDSIVGAEIPMQQQGRRGTGGGGNDNPHPPPQKCPRCDSLQTKFCYYNNYSLTQPRYYCKSCRRYWTHGGTLRNVPIGGGCRKSKRALTRPAPPSINLSPRTQGSVPPAMRPPNPTAVVPPPPPPMGGSFYAGGAFLSSLARMQPVTGQGVAPVNLSAAAGGGSQFGGNVAHLHGVSLPLKSPAAAHQSHYFPAPPSVISSGYGSWSQGFVNTGGASTSSSAATSSGWSGNDQAGPSMTPNQWTDAHQRFNPSQ